MQMVITKVKLKPGEIDACARLFEMTNPDLVRHETDWLGARMAVDRSSDTITVMALWRTAEAYRRLSSSAAFRSAMEKFSALFASPPEITITDVLVEMTPESVSATSG